MTAFGYVRQSRTEDPATALSPQVQRERILALAKAHGDDDLTVIEDLDVSGAKIEERVGYVRLVDAIQSGDAHAVYAFDLSRLHRNTREALRFFELAEEHHVTVTLVEGNIDTRGPTGTLILTVLSAMNAWTSQMLSAKIKASLALKRRSGWRDGGHVYGTHNGEDPAAVVAAVRATESRGAAARLLNLQHVPTRNAKSRGWSPSAVKSIVRRVAPELLTDPANSPAKGSRAGERPYRLARLLRCGTCDALLTPATDRSHVGGAVRYYCHTARTRPHARTMVSEAALLPVVAAEAALFDYARNPRRYRKGVVGDTEKLDALEAKRARWIEQYGEGLIDKPTRDAKLAVVAEAESKLTAARWMRSIELPPDVEHDDPARVNLFLRRLFTRVVVDMSAPGHKGMTVPASATFEWRDPSLRVEDADD